MPDPYLLPNCTLRNRLGIDDAAESSLREDQLAATRQAILVKKGLNSPFDFDRLKEIHRYLFQDVYEWAGAARTCELRKATFLGSAESPKQFTKNEKIAEEPTAFSRSWRKTVSCADGALTVSPMRRRICSSR